MCYEQNSNIECKENLTSLTEECVIERTNAGFRHIEEVLQSLSKMLDTFLSQVNDCREPKMFQSLSSLRLKVIMSLDIITKSAEECVSPGILKGLLECVTMQNLFQKGDSMIIEVLPDNTLRISGEHPHESE